MEKETKESTLVSPLIQHGTEKAETAVELKKQMRLAGPLVVVSFLQYSLQMISIMFVGHLDDQLSLSSSSMATSFAGVTGFSFMVTSFLLFILDAGLVC